MRESDRLHVEEPRQSALIDPFVSVEIRQHLPLRSDQPGIPRMLFKSLFEQPRDFMQQKSEWVRIDIHLVQLLKVISLPH